MANDFKGEYKGVKLGIIGTNKNGNKFIKLGDTRNEGEKARFNYTVQVRVLDAEGNVVHKVDNPFVNLKKVEREGSKIDYELTVFKD